MTRRTLRNWVHRYNADGIAGLWTRTGLGRPSRLTDGQMGELKAMVIKGPDPERHKVVRWRCVDPREEITTRWSMTVCEQTIGKWLRRFRMTRLQPRLYHPKKDLDAEMAFKKTSPAW